MSKFDEDQIVMASFTDVLGQIICKTALQWSVSIKSDPVKVTVLNQQQGHGLLWLTDTCREQRLAHMVRSNRQTTVAQIAKNVDADLDRKVSEYTVHHYWLCMGLLTSRGAHADPCPPLKALTMGTWASELDELVQEWFKEHNKEFEVLNWPLNSPNLKPVCAVCGANKSNPWLAHLATYAT